MRDHTHMVLRVPPKYSIAMLIGYFKGKAALQIHGQFQGVKQGVTGKRFGSRGYCVGTIGLDEEMSRESVKYRNQQEQQEDPNY